MNIDELAAAFRRVPALLDQHVEDALAMGAQMVASEAKSNHSYTDRSDVLTPSIMPDGTHGVFTEDSLSADVSAGAPYAVFVEKGTRPHVIRPRYRKALRWPVEGGFMFAKMVNHPGTEGAFFLEDAGNKVAETIANKLIPEAIDLAFVQAGFDRD